MKIVISPCLVGIRTRWNEDCEEIEGLINLVKSGQAVFMCAEQLGGMTTPREPSEIDVRLRRIFYKIYYNNCRMDNIIFND